MTLVREPWADLRRTRRWQMRAHPCRPRGRPQATPVGSDSGGRCFDAASTQGTGTRFRAMRSHPTIRPRGARELPGGFDRMRRPRSPGANSVDPHRCRTPDPRSSSLSSAHPSRRVQGHERSRTLPTLHDLRRRSRVCLVPSNWALARSAAPRESLAEGTWRWRLRDSCAATSRPSAGEIPRRGYERGRAERGESGSLGATAILSR